MRAVRLVCLLLAAVLLCGFKPARVGGAVLVPINNAAVSEYGYIATGLATESAYSTSQQLPATAEPLPERYDLRESGRVTAVGNQSNYGICWAFSTLSSGASSLLSRYGVDGRDYDLSERHLTWAAYNGLVEDESDLMRGDSMPNDGDYLEAGGNWLLSAATLSRRAGAVSEEKYPFTSERSQMVCDPSDLYESDYKLTDVNVLDDDMNAIKQRLMKSGALTASYYSNTADYISRGGSTYYCSAEGETANHMITIIGWDDNCSADNFDRQLPGDGAWLAQNSWGSEWGDEGCFWISYYDGSICDFAAFDFTEQDYDNKLSYNGASPTLVLRFSTNSTTTAMKYSSPGYQSLRAVAFFTLQPNTDYKISVYDGDFERSKTSAPLYSESGTMRYSGYHTLQLAEPCYFAAGDEYTVHITLKATAERELIVPIEDSHCCYGEAGRSYFLDTDGWYDSNEMENSADLYVHLLTNDESIRTGDVNGDARINAKDVLLLRQLLAQWSVSVQPLGADMNGDGSINARDLLYLRRAISGN